MRCSNYLFIENLIMMYYPYFRKLLFIPVVFFLYLCTAFTQAPGEIERSIEFTGDDVSETMIIEIGKDVASLSAVLSGEISTGSLVVSVVDPKGAKRNAFSLDCDQSDDGQYEARSISSGSVVTVVKGEKGKRHVITETDSEDGAKSVVITTDGSGKASVMQIESGEHKTSVKVKEKVKDKSKKKRKPEQTAKTDEDQKGVVVITRDQAGAKGVFVESIEDPAPGNWKIVMEGKQVKGMLSVVINKG